MRSLIAGEREGGSTKSLVILSADHNIRNNDAMAEPERYEIDIQQVSCVALKVLLLRMF